MTLKKKIADNFSRAAQIYNEKAQLQKNIADHLVEISRPYLSPDQKTADLGCGTGFISQTLNRPLVQLDIAFEMCRAAVRKSAPAICADIEDMPLKSGHFDMVFSSSAIQWFSDPSKSFAEINRILKPGGYFCFTTFGPQTLLELRSAYEKLSLRPKVHNFLPVESLISCLLAANFNITGKETALSHLEFDNVLALFRYISNIGAGTEIKNAEINNDRLSAGNLKKLQQIYAAEFSRREKIYSTWQSFYFIARKPV